MKILLALVSTVPLFLFFPLAAFGQLSTNGIVQRVSSSVVTIEGKLGTGSGVVLDSDGIVVTNFHVIEGESEISIKSSNGDVYTAVSVVDYDLSKDIVLLKVKAFDIPFSKMGNSNQVSIGDDVVIIGSPRGLSQSVSRGIISAKRDSGDGYTLFQTDAAVSPGSSGGGMFNSNGELIGIVVSKLTSAENVNFVIPINYIAGMYSETPQYTLSEITALKQDESIDGGTAAISQDLGNFLNSTAISFTKAEGDFWVTEYESEGLTQAIGSYLNGEEVITIAYPNVDASALTLDEVKNILSINYDFNYAKVGMDEEGTIVVLNETLLASSDATAYERIVKNVALSALYLEANIRVGGSEVIPPFLTTLKSRLRPQGPTSVWG